MTMSEKVERFFTNQRELLIDDLETILRHTESGDYSLEEIGEELEDLIGSL